MRPRRHFRGLVLATLGWAGFGVAGRPDYYQQYSDAAMAAFVVALLIPIGAIIHRVLRDVRSERRMRVALWLAFYFTVPLALYDWLCCGLYEGHGAGFLTEYWYLSVYYLIPWILLPGVARALDRGQAGEQAQPPETGD